MAFETCPQFTASRKRPKLFDLTTVWHSHHTINIPANIQARKTFLTSSSQGDLNTVRCQLDNGIDINIRAPKREEADEDEKLFDGGTALNLASMNGHLDVVQDLLKRGADIEVNHYEEDDYCGSTPLFEAATNGHPTVVETLLDHGASAQNPRNPIPIEPTVLHVLARISTSDFTDSHLRIVEVLLDRRVVDINVRSDPEAPLDYAAERGNTRLIELLLRKGADIDGQNFSIAHAASGGHMHIVQRFLGTGVNYRSHYSALWNACRKGHLDIVRLLLGHDVKTTDELLHVTTACGQVDVVKYLVDRGYSREAEVTDTETALHHAKNASMAELLLALGFKIEARDSKGETALFRAAQQTSLEVLKVLLDAGADLNARNNNGETVIFAPLVETYRIRFVDETALANVERHYGNYAVFHKRLEVYMKHPRRGYKWRTPPPIDSIKLLLEAGIDVNIRNHNGQTALHKVLTPQNQGGPWEYNLPSHGAFQAINMLLAEGADPSAQDSSGVSALHQAALAADCPIIELLLDAGVDVNVRMNNGRTPLFETISAAHPCHTETIIVAAKVLLNRGADVHARTADGKTVLHEAVLNKKEPGEYAVEILKLMLERGVDPYARDANRDTALDLASKDGNAGAKEGNASSKEILSLLREAVGREEDGWIIL